MRMQLPLFLAAALAIAPTARADAPTAVDSAALPALAVVEAFSAALQAGEMAKLPEFLDEGLLVLESGGAERSREEYLGHHAGADAAFLKDAQVSVTRRRAQASGDFAWVGTESELRRQGKVYLGTETMLLRRSGDAWRIVHIHWSSRPKEK